MIKINNNAKYYRNCNNLINQLSISKSYFWLMNKKEEKPQTTPGKLTPENEKRCLKYGQRLKTKCTIQADREVQFPTRLQLYLHNENTYQSKILSFPHKVQL